METPPAEELLKKIQELEAGQAHLKQEMSKLKLTTDPQPDNQLQYRQQRSHSMSPQRTGPGRRGGGGAGLDAVSAWNKGSESFRHSSPLQKESRSSSTSSTNAVKEGENRGPSALKFTDKQCLNILQSMGQSVHIFDLSGRIIYWNRTAENVYGYPAAEALGQDAIQLIVDPRDFSVANSIIRRITMGESWVGQFPVKNKNGDRFTIVSTNTPFYDDDGTLVGIICVSSDSRQFQEMKVALNSEADSSFNRPQRASVTTKLGLDSQQPLQAAIASKISNLASKVSNKMKSKMRTGDNSLDHEGGSGDSHLSDHGFLDVALSDHREDANSNGASTPRGDAHASSFGTFSHVEDKSPRQLSRDSGDESEGKPVIHKIITSKAEAWIGKKGLSWPWKGNEREGSNIRSTRFMWPWLQNDQENETIQQRTPSSGAIPESQSNESNRPTNNEASGSWSSSVNVNSTSSASSSGSTSSSAINKVLAGLYTMHCGMDQMLQSRYSPSKNIQKMSYLLLDKRYH